MFVEMSSFLFSDCHWMVLPWGKSEGREIERMTKGKVCSLHETEHWYVEKMKHEKKFISKRLKKARERGREMEKGNSFSCERIFNTFPPIDELKNKVRRYLLNQREQEKWEERVSGARDKVSLDEKREEIACCKGLSDSDKFKREREREREGLLVIYRVGRHWVGLSNKTRHDDRENREWTVLSLIFFPLTSERNERLSDRWSNQRKSSNQKGGAREEIHGTQGIKNTCHVDSSAFWFYSLPHSLPLLYFLLSFPLLP